MGAIYCLLSAAAFGAMAIFGKLAYDEGVTVGDLLLVRFVVAAVVLLGIVWWRGGSARSRRTAVAAFAMGAVGYAAQSASYFAALDRIDASLLTLLLYLYPVLVMAGAVALKRESWSRAERPPWGWRSRESCWCCSAPPPTGSTGSGSR